MLAPVLGERVGPLVELNALPGGDAGRLGSQDASQHGQVVASDDPADFAELHRADRAAAHGKGGAATR